MARPKKPPPQTSEEAWQRLVGTWSFTVASGNSRSVTRYRFTSDRKMIFSSSLTGGLLPGPLTSEIPSDVTAVALQGDEILLTIGDSHRGRPQSAMTLRFAADNQIVVEDQVFTREEP